MVTKDSWNKEYLLLNNGCQEDVNFEIDAGAEANVLLLTIAKNISIRNCTKYCWFDFLYQTQNNQCRQDNNHITLK